MALELVTIPDVELLTVGMNWPGVNGDMTFRFDHLHDAMVAANDDPHIQRPRIKIGHTDPRFNTGEGDHDPFAVPGDGEPALGSIENLRLVNGEAVLIGDLVDVPLWLAEIIVAAYPNRSIEGSYIGGRWEVVTPGGKEYSFVLTACALLGIFRPAVEDLEDLKAFLIDGDGVEYIDEGGAEASGGMVIVTPPKAARGPGAPAAAAEIDKVVRQFIDQICIDECYWWWPRAVWTEEGELIADTDDGGLVRVPFTTNDAQEVIFSDPVEVLETFKDVPASAKANVLVAAASNKPARTYGSRSDIPALAERKKEGGVAPAANNSSMDPKLLRAALGLPEDATDEQVTTAAEARKAELDAAEAEPATGGEGGEGGGEGGEPEAAPEGGDGSEGGEAPAGGDTPPASASAVPEGMVLVPADQWAKVQEGSAAGASLAASAETKRRDDTIVAATAAGKISPADAQSMENLHGKDADSFYRLLTEPVASGGLKAGIVPVTARGGSRPDAGGAADPNQLTAALASFGVTPVETA